MPDFSIDSLAKYLHLAPAQVTRLADRGKLPGRKVGGLWRFARAEIHHWLEHRIGLADEDDVLDVANVLRQRESEEAIRLEDLLPLEAIAVPLPARTRNSVFSAMVDLADRTGWLWDREKMLEAVKLREEMSPTAMENGVALLHPRRPMPNILAQAFLALGVSPGGIPFGGNRGALTDVFFLIGSVDDRGHLRTLGRLSRLLLTPGVLDAIRQAPAAAAARTALLTADAQLEDL